MKTYHKLIFGNSADIKELQDGSVHLVVTSFPYFNAHFDYPDLFEDYNTYIAHSPLSGNDQTVVVSNLNSFGSYSLITCFLINGILTFSIKTK